MGDYESLYGEHYVFRGSVFELPDLIQKIEVQMKDNLENAVVEQIIKTAKEEGITDVIILNKQAVSEALRKQIPQKPTPHKVKVDKIRVGNGCWGKGTTIYKCPNCGEFISRTNKCCGECGQALDWELINYRSSKNGDEWKEDEGK